MAGEVVSMDVRLAIVTKPPEKPVAQFCREKGISRATFYVWQGRFKEFGLEGLEPLSRAPKTSPHRIRVNVEDAIVELRKDLEGSGFDHGASTIQWHLERRGISPVPSEATIWRALKRRGFIEPEPKKRPKAAFRRFEASRPNELWQADFIEWKLVSGPVTIMTFLDDHSRVALRVKALRAPTSEATWQTFSEAAAFWGVPLGQLTDNGLNFSGRLRGYEVFFETQLRAIGVIAKTARPYHPQTCGKVERFQQTLKKSLRRQPIARTLNQLQHQIDAFVDYYNQHRPHRGIGRITPAERWAATPPAINLGVAIPGPDQRTLSTVNDIGIVQLSRYRIHVGVEWRGRPVEVRYDDSHAAVFINNRLIRMLTLDPRRAYQPSGRKRGGPRKSLA